MISNPIYGKMPKMATKPPTRQCFRSFMAISILNDHFPNWESSPYRVSPYARRSPGITGTAKQPRVSPPRRDIFGWPGRMAGTDRLTNSVMIVIQWVGHSFPEGYPHHPNVFVVPMKKTIHFFGGSPLWKPPYRNHRRWGSPVTDRPNSGHRKRVRSAGP